MSWRNMLITMVIWALTVNVKAQVYHSYVSYRPTYDSEVEELHTTIFINEVENKIVFYNATYEGEVTNLQIDSIKIKHWFFEIASVKTYFCTDIDEWRAKVYVIDLSENHNLIKLIYRWDEISIEEYFYLVKG